MRDVDSQFAGVPFQTYIGFGLLRGARNSVDRLAAIATDQFGAAIDHHLRRVVALQVKGAGVLFLAQAALAARKRIAPAERIPVVHVLG